MKRQPERNLQIQVASYLRLALKPPVVWSAFPAGGGGRVRGAFLKAMGLARGWPDILVMQPIQTRFGPFSTAIIGIELKAPGGRMSIEQKRMSVDFQNVGGIYRVAWSVEEVEQILRKCGVPLHASVGAREAA